MNEKQKSKAPLIVFIIVLVLLTNFVTYTLLTTFGISIGGKSVIAVDSSYTAKKINKLIYLYDELDNKYLETLDKDTLWEGVYKGLFEAAGDEYTVYMDKESFASYTEDITGNYAGIGVRIVMGNDELVTVISVFANSPAEKAGMQVGDKIIAIEDMDATKFSVDEAASNMRGEAGTTVNITILRGEKNIDLSLERAQLSIESVTGSILDNNIGYINISEFSSSVSDQFISTLDNQLKNGITSLIIDLRNNPGGDVDETINIADRLLGNCMIIYTENKIGKKTEYTSTTAQSLDIPIVVLINEYSASASEILAISLKDNDAATLIGTKSYGKGIIQTFKGMLDGSGYKITTEQYFSPIGTVIHKVGVEPDVVVELPDDITYEYGKIPANQDTQLQAAIKYLTQNK
jgi:carboxyl-terminal processing protease